MRLFMYQRLRDLREDKDLTQKQIADLFNLHRNTYNRYECGTREIPLNLAIMLADFYDVSLDYLAGRTKRKE